ncbi:MAG: uroporphyrinogen decarboxylase family protein [Planctomycetota bacterium]
MTLTPRERVDAILRHRPADHVPFTCYESKLPTCSVERELRNRGLCVIERRIGVHSVETPNARTVEVKEGDKTTTFRRTPFGTLRSVFVSAPGTAWCMEYPFKSPDDYKRLQFIYRDARVRTDYDAFLKAKERLGEDVFMRPAIHYSPLQFVCYSVMGVETFCYEWAERADEILRLCDTVAELRRKEYLAVAKGPADTINYGGNVCPEVMGLERYEKYIAPHYEEAAEVLHRHGKLIGVHFDANTRLLARAIARSSLDYIEAFTPPPDCDLPLAEALAAWPDKTLWINFPSSVHLASRERIADAMRALLREAGTGERLIVGITEDVPEDRWQESFLAITEVLNSEGTLPLRLT